MKYYKTINYAYNIWKQDTYVWYFWKNVGPFSGWQYYGIHRPNYDADTRPGAGALPIEISKAEAFALML